MEIINDLQNSTSRHVYCDWLVVLVIFKAKYKNIYQFHPLWNVTNKKNQNIFFILDDS